MGCGGRERLGAAKGPPLAAAAPKVAQGSRWFLGDLTGVAWVHHDDQRDLALVSGARIESDPQGLVVRAGWADEDLGLGEPSIGQRIPPHLGGGFLFAAVVGTESTLTRATEHAGVVTPVARLGAQVRGMRASLREVAVMAETGVFGFDPRSGALGPAPFGALADVVALDAERAVRLDLFGRAYVTRDGGATFRDAQLDVGSSTRMLATSGSEVWLETAFGRALVEQGGLRIVSEQPYQRWGRDYQRPFQIVPRGPTPRQDTWLNGWNPAELSPAAVVARGGVPLSDGTIVAAQRSAVVHFDPSQGKPLSITTSWFPNGLDCRATPGPELDQVLYACSFDDGNGYGRYVLRSDGAKPPRVERFFGGGSSFVATLEGGLAYLGDCSDEMKSYDRGWQEPAPRTKVVCVRARGGEWAERSLPLPDDELVLAWAPSPSGEIAALVRPVEARMPLPKQLGSLRPGEAPRRPTFVSEGVRVVRAELPAGLDRSFDFGRGMGEGGYGEDLVDHRFALHEDGSVSGWLDLRNGEGPLSPMAWSSAGVLTERDLPDDARAVATSGARALVVDGDGVLHETSDFGRTWRAAGRSPLPPQSSLYASTCSPAGCALGGLARLGWGPSTLPVTVTEYDVDRGRPRVPTAGGELPALSCAPSGLPTPIPRKKHASSPTTLQTPWGESIEVFREIEEREAAKKAALPMPPSAGKQLAPAPSAAPTAAPSGPVLSTATWHYRPPFDRALLPRRINATNASELQQRPAATLVVDRSGGVALHLIGDKGEVVLDDDDVVTLPLFERRYASSSAALSTGARLARDRVLMLGESRGRLGLESHGQGSQPPPAGLVADRRLFGKRNVAVGHRAGGGLAMLVLDGPPARSAGMIALDALGTSPAGDAVRLAPWSTLTRGDDPACAGDDGVRAVLLLESAAWLGLASDELPGLSSQGPGRFGHERDMVALVRWSASRVCLDALRVGAYDAHRGGQVTLVSVWAPAASKGAKKGAGVANEGAAGAASKPPGAVLRTRSLLQPLRCDLVRPAARAPSPRTP